MQMPRQPLECLFQLAAAYPLLEPAVAGLERRILLRKLAPLRSRSQHPEHPVQHRARVLPRTPTVVRAPRSPQHRLNCFPLFIGQLPAPCHRRLRSRTELLQNAPFCSSQMFMRLVLVKKLRDGVIWVVWARRMRNSNHCSRRPGQLAVAVCQRAQQFDAASPAGCLTHKHQSHRQHRHHPHRQPRNYVHPLRVDVEPHQVPPVDQ